ncbi:hypothetical protein PAXRUDRAFT_408388 [Paxillus rubicundulus Ve08.2h10]|uniref:Uncharacterized protein n=1 Tax=Paxillus rubicundulus Ve08.2h10 TaxID=930991 RepID=A0A0D0E2W7_9AGAM|nr:hypothetical protein PAXRUDRAFT_408388 [Paxillus rubicundulus Ve08.2h10]
MGSNRAPGRVTNAWIPRHPFTETCSWCRTSVLCIDPVMLDSTTSSGGRRCCVPVYHKSTRYLLYYFPSIHTVTPLRTVDGSGIASTSS